VAYWLLKTEPSSYSFDQLRKDQRTVWDGVGNPLALKHLREIRQGDQVFIYHTGPERQVVGIAKAVSGAYPDPSRKNPKLAVVDLAPVRALPKPVSLAAIKQHPRLKQHELVRLPRLSVMRISEEEWKLLLGLAGS
jgi:predicted RNA-binding protein with PUA-like domain